MTKRLPKIYTVFCFGMLLIVALLSRFKGELHLSSNGYLLLKRSIGGSNNDALNPETRRTNTTTFEVKINGDRIYWMSWWDDFEVDRIDGSRVDRFFVLSEHYGLTEFHAWRTPEKLNYKIINNIFTKEKRTPPSQCYANMDILAEYIATYYWYPAGHQVTEDYGNFNQGRSKMTYLTLGLLLFLQGFSLRLLLTRWREGQKHDILKRRICQIIFAILQLLVFWMDLSKYVYFLP